MQALQNEFGNRPQHTELHFLLRSSGPTVVLVKNGFGPSRPAPRTGQETRNCALIATRGFNLEPSLERGDLLVMGVIQRLGSGSGGGVTPPQ
jgi:hypothetical protein